MKANLLLTLLCTFTLQVGFSQWTAQPSPTKNNLKAVNFYNNRIGFAVGEQGTVIRTRTGGADWELVNFPITDDLTDVVLLDSGIVIVTTAGDEPAVYRSQNAGNSWQKELNDTRPFYAAKTPGKKLFSISDHIFESNNAGKTWVSDFDLNNTSTYKHVSFTNEQNGMVGGNISGFVTYSATFERTADSGKTWYGSYPYDFPNANGFSAMSQINSDTAFIFTNFYRGFAEGDSCQLVMLTNYRLRSSLAGFEWHFKANIITNSFPDKLYAAKFFSGGIAYTLGEKGIIYRSANYGKKWNKNYEGKTPLNGIYMLNEVLGYAVGNGGTILKTAAAATALATEKMLAVKVFPNPASDNASLNFALQKATILSIQLTDERGNLSFIVPAKNYEKGAQRVQLPLSGMQRGVYQVSLLNNGKPVGKTSLLVVK